MKSSPLTVITASFNSQETIGRTIESILSQDHRPLEYIIIDGASTDKTCEIIQGSEKRFEEKGILFKWISETDHGIYSAWNKGVKKASGEWISFLGSDDIYTEQSLDEYNKAINDLNSVDFITAKAKIKSKGKLLRDFGEPWRWSIFKKEMKILHAGGFLNKSYFQEYGLFEESYKITGYYELLLRKGANLKVGFIDKFLVEMEDGGISNSNISEAFREATHAKIHTAKRNKLLANLERNIVLTKILIKKALAN